MAQPKHRQVLGRVSVTRVDRRDLGAISGPAASPAERPADAPCPRCGATLSDASRRALLDQAELRCSGCGATARVERTP